MMLQAIDVTEPHQFTSLAFGRCFILDQCFAQDTLRVANRFPTPASKINDFFGLFDDTWGVRAAFPGRFRGFRGPGRN